MKTHHAVKPFGYVYKIRIFMDFFIHQRVAYDRAMFIHDLHAIVRSASPKNIFSICNKNKRTDVPI